CGSFLREDLSSFIKHQLGVAPEDDDAESLRLELNTLQQKYDQLMEENKDLRDRAVITYRTNDADAASAITDRS
uniref:Uncharacterized protein n=1 Tax=Cyprinus carpio TaxID=7962 RepID=A0A8C2GP31_CYPCA